MEVEDQDFNTAAADLEKALSQETPAGDVSPEQKFVKSIQDAVTDLRKGKGGQPSDLKAEKDKRGELTDPSKDPAESPKKSGQGYKDSSVYETRKGHESEGRESESGEGDEPSFFKGHGKKKKKHKSSEGMHESSSGRHSSSGMKKGEEEDVTDATEFMENMGDAVDHLTKSVRRLEEGLACFGELLTDMADPRRDKLMVSLAKGVSYLISENKELRKSLTQQVTLMKSVSQLPGAPRIAGLSLQAPAGEGASTEGADDGYKKLSKAQRDQAFQLKCKRVPQEDINKAIEDGKLGELFASYKGVK